MIFWFGAAQSTAPNQRKIYTWMKQRQLFDWRSFPKSAEFTENTEKIFKFCKL